MKKQLWKNRNEQVNFAMHLGDILLKIFGPIFDVRNQGGGKVANMVIDGRGKRPKNIREIKNYLVKNYQIIPTDISKNHGHASNTIVVNISEISENSKIKVEKDFKRMIVDPVLVKRKIKITEQKGEDIKKVDENLISQPEIPEIEKETKKETEKMETFSVVKSGRSSIMGLLNAMFRFEGYEKDAKTFSFDEKKEEDIQVIKFIGENEAKMGLCALNWRYGTNNSECPVRDGSDIMINFFALDILKDRRRPTYLFFVLPPLRGSSEEDIFKRGKKVLTGYEPKVKILNEDEFEMTYTSKTNEKILSFILEMGWEARIEGNSIISKFRNFGAGKAVISKPAPISSIEKVEEPKVSTKLVAVKHLFSKDEAIMKFEELYENDDLWFKVSPDNQIKVVNVLKNHYKNGSFESFATYLVIEHTRPLWSDEERVLELNSIYSNHQFMSLAVKVQNTILEILKSRLGDVDPDALVSGLLELF